MKKTGVIIGGIFIMSLLSISVVKLKGKMAEEERISAIRAEQENREAVLLLTSSPVSQTIDYFPAKLTDIPQCVKSAVVSRYAAYCIHSVYQGSDRSYKLTLKNDSAEIVVYYSASGEWLRKEVTKTPRIVALI